MVDFNYVINTGVIVPDTSTLRDGVIAEWRTAFGQDLAVTPETPQGVIITMEVESRDAMVRNNAEVANQINPDLAGGVWLDALWSLTAGGRRGASRSRLIGVEFRGTALTLIPAGSIATVQGTGAQFYTIENILLDNAGFATGLMESVDTGPIAAAPNTLVQVASSVLGWEQVTNPNAAELGRLVESDVAGRRRRRQTLALQSVALPEAIISRLYDIDGVRSLSFRENVTDASIVIDGVTLVEHSIYVCVEGGTNLEVATALLETKSLGAAWNGSVVVNVVEPSSGQTYEVKFARPVERTFLARVTVKSSTLDVQRIVPAAIAQYVAGELEGEAGLVIDSDLSPFELAGAVNMVEPRIFVTKVEISENGTTWTTAEIPILLNQVARLPESAVSVIVV